MAISGKDLAKMLNLSPSSVSIVLNNRPGVADATRARVICKIKELGCEYLLKAPAAPTASGSESGPVASQSHNIGFLIYRRGGEILNESPFFNYALNSIGDYLSRRGYTLKLIYMDRQQSAAQKKLLLQDSNCVGLIIDAVEMLENDLDFFTGIPFPFVLLDNSFQTRDVDCVAINNFMGITKAIRYLYKMGHRKIGYIRSKTQINSFEERFRQFRFVLEQMELPFQEDFVINVSYNERLIQQEVSEYLSSVDRDQLPTAFLSDNDLLSCNAMQAFKAAGFSVPEDISFVGFDDRPICGLVDPPMTTIRVPLQHFGPNAAKLLLEKMEEHRASSIKIDIGVELVERKSVLRIRR